MKMDFCENLRLDLREERYSVFEYVRKLQREDVVLETVEEVLEPIEAMFDSKPFVLRNCPEWEPERQSRFIESLIVNLPVPPFCLLRPAAGHRWVIDGRQRSRALLAFFGGELVLCGLEVLPWLNGLTWQQLQAHEDYRPLVAWLEDRQLNFQVLGPSVPMPLVRDLLRRLHG